MNTINKIALSNNKKNRLRSILIMITIALTTMLLAILSTYAYGTIKTYKANTGILYGDFYGTYRNVSVNQIVEMNRRAEFTEIGLMSDAGIVNEKEPVHVLVVDRKLQKMLSLDKQILKGDFPQREDEIVAQSTFFYKMGYSDVKVGDKVKLQYRRNRKEKYSEKEFVVSGLLEEPNQDSSPEASIVMGSEELLKANFSPEEINYKVYFKIQDSVRINYDNADQVLKDLANKCGIKEENVYANKVFIMWTKNPGYENILIYGIIGLCIIAFSIIVIYNIFQVGVVEKIQEYGKIKALGATQKQMRKIIFREGMYLTILSTPVGAILGYLVAAVSFDWLMSKSNQITAGTEMIKVSIFSLPVLLISVALAFITVILALRKPMKVVESISPVDAVRYQEGMEKRKRSIRVGKKEVTLYSMAFANISVNKRRTVTTIITMGLSCVLFITLANYTENIDVEYEARRVVEFGQFKLSLEYYLDDEGYPKNNLDYLVDNDPISEDLVETISSIKGVTDVKLQRILSVTENGEKTDMAVLNREQFNHLVNERGMGELDYDKVTEEGGVVRGYAHFLESEGYRLNEPLDVSIKTRSKTVNFNARIVGAFATGNTEWFITEDSFKKLKLDAESYGQLWVNCNSKEVDQVEKKINEVLYGVEHVAVESFHNAMLSSQLCSTLMRSACYLFLGVFGLIGFMNLANTMIINIITKKHEYGVLQAIGMTNVQLNRSLQIQGMIFTAGTTVVSLAIGIPAGYGLFQYAKDHGVYGVHNYHFPLVAVVGMVLVLTFMQVVLSLILSRSVKKESIVDRIRCQG